MSVHLKVIKIIVCVVLAFAASGLSAATFTGWGYKVFDGDSITVVITREKSVPVQLEGIDCPELEQEFGKEARDFTKSFVYKKKLNVEIKTYDTEKRILGRVFVDEKDLSLALIEAGLAWYDKKNSSDKTLAKAQKKAKKGKIGLWSNPKPSPPWIFRAIQEQKQKQKEAGKIE